MGSTPFPTAQLFFEFSANPILWGHDPALFVNESPSSIWLMVWLMVQPQRNKPHFSSSCPHLNLNIKKQEWTQTRKMFKNRLVHEPKRIEAIKTSLETQLKMVGRNLGKQLSDIQPLFRPSSAVLKETTQDSLNSWAVESVSPLLNCFCRFGRE